jgi:hypothetical protein
MDLDPSDLRTCALYRMAYGRAHELANAAERSNFWSGRRARGEVADIPAEVVRELTERGSSARGDEAAEAFVREAAGDALEGRRPRW